MAGSRRFLDVFGQRPSFVSEFSIIFEPGRQEANTSKSSKADPLGSIPSDISNDESPPSSLGIGTGNKALSVEPMSAGAGEATTSPEDPNCHSGVQSTESQDSSARGTGSSDDEETGITMGRSRPATADKKLQRLSCFTAIGRMTLKRRTHNRLPPANTNRACPGLLY